MEYTRSPSRFEERTFSPSFFFRWPLMKPRTLWVCQPVARMRARRVAPLGLPNISALFSSFCWVESRRLISFSALILKTVIKLLCEGFPHHDSHRSGRRNKQVLCSQQPRDSEAARSTDIAS